MAKAKDQTDEVKRGLTTRTERVPPIPPENFLSFGLTTLNLAVSGKTERGIAKGQYLYFVGESSSGKTWVSMQLFAEAVRNPHFDDYQLIADLPENGAQMDVQRYFGRRVLDRLVPPRGDRDSPVYSTTVQEFYFNVDAALDRGPCIYMLDSMDALTDINAEEKFEAEREIYETGKGKAPGSMGMEKAKSNSQNINRVVRRLTENGSILIVISQTRNRTGGTFPGRTRSGGDALKFYATVEVWTKVKEKIEVYKLGKDRTAGSIIQFDVRKNRISGVDVDVFCPFYPAIGFDDIGGCVDYLLDEKVWKVKEKQKGERGSGKIVAEEFKLEADRESLIRHIQLNDLERELQLIVAERWREVQRAITPERKSRYADDE